MTLTRLTTYILSAFLLVSVSVAQAADRGVFRGKAETQHDLSDLEQRKLAAEFDSKFGAAEAGAFQKLNNNPWANKKERQQQHANKLLQLSNSWGSCREYAYKQRNMCYAQGGDAYTCERYYDARAKRCDESFD